MRAASTFQLSELVEQCEKYLVGIVGLKDCVQLYVAAEELGVQKLRDHCSSLISAHWVGKVFLQRTSCQVFLWRMMIKFQILFIGRPNRRGFQRDAWFFII